MSTIQLVKQLRAELEQEGLNLDWNQISKSLPNGLSMRNFKPETFDLFKFCVLLNYPQECLSNFRAITSKELTDKITELFGNFSPNTLTNWRQLVFIKKGSRFVGEMNAIALICLCQAKRQGRITSNQHHAVLLQEVFSMSKHLDNTFLPKPEINLSQIELKTDAFTFGELEGVLLQSGAQISYSTLRRYGVRCGVVVLKDKLYSRSEIISLLKVAIAASHTPKGKKISEKQ